MQSAQMLPVYILLFVLATSSDAEAQIVKTRVLAEGDSFKLLGSNAFPKDLDAEVYIGADLFPYFRTEGTEARVKTATIDVDLSTSVSVLRKDVPKGHVLGVPDKAYVLFLSLEDDEEKLFGLFDLNIDGTWDVKRTPGREHMNHIYFESKWLVVDQVDSLRSPLPTAAKGDTRYEFREKWILSVER